jgi:O-antigen/teichoic acid export membrane protein
VIKSTVYVFAGRASNAFFLFLLTLVVSRQLGPALFGVFSFLTTVVVSANCFSGLGLDIWMVREVTKNPLKAKFYLSNILGLKVATSLIAIFVIFFIFQATDLPDMTLNLLWILSISLLFNSISQTLWHYGDCFKQFIFHSSLWALSNIIKSLLGVVLVLLYQELEHLIWGVVASEGIALILSYYVIHHKFGTFVPEFQLAVWKEFLTRSAPIGIGMIFSILYFRLDIVMLQLLAKDEVVGFYSAAYRLFEVAVILPHSLMLVLFPNLVEEFHADRSRFQNSYKRALALYSLIGGSIALVLWGGAPAIINLIYGDKFLPSTGVLEIIAWAILLFFINYLLSNVLITSGREKVNSWNLVGATVLNITLNLSWIPQYGAIGAAWATLICETILIVALSLQIRKSFE